MTAFEGVTATLQIGSHTGITNWHVYVAPIRVLIGMDFLVSLDAVTYTGKSSNWKGDYLGHPEL